MRRRMNSHGSSSPATRATAQTITVVAIQAPTPLIRNPSESSTVTTRATKHASSAELPAIASEPRMACFWIIGRTINPTPVNTSTSSRRAAAVSATPSTSRRR